MLPKLTYDFPAGMNVLLNGASDRTITGGTPRPACSQAGGPLDLHEMSPAVPYAEAGPAYTPLPVQVGEEAQAQHIGHRPPLKYEADYYRHNNP